MKYAWIARHKADWPITLAWEALEVSASGYFEHWRCRDRVKPSRPRAKKLCWSFTPKSNKNTPGRKFRKICSPAAFEWARNVCES